MKSSKEVTSNSHDVSIELCNIYVGVRIDLREEVGKKVENFWRVKGLPRPAFKVKINKGFFS